MSRTTKIVAAIIFLIALGLFGFLFLLDRSADLDRDIEDVDIIGETPVPVAPTFTLSSNIIEQGGALGFAVRGVSEDPKVLFGQKQIPLIKIADGYVGVVGMALAEVPRDEILRAILSGGETFEEKISIIRKDYGVSVLSVPQKAAEQGVTTQSLSKNIVADDNKTILNAVAFSNVDAYYKDDFVSPTKTWIDVGGFGITRKSGSSAIRHLGTDLEAKEGDDIFATNRGKVVFAEYLTNYGNSIIIDHGQGLSSLYLHLSKMNVEEGEIVERNQKIGEAGSTGLYSFETHLHFSIRLREVSLDPKAFIDAINTVL